MHLHELSQSLQGVTTALSCYRAKSLTENIVLLLDLVSSNCVPLQSVLMYLQFFFRIDTNANFIEEITGLVC